MDNIIEAIETPFGWSDLEEHKTSGKQRTFLTAHGNCGENELYGKTCQKNWLTDIFKSPSSNPVICLVQLQRERR